ncbi:MAG: DUF975 family protein [Candidatus Margulisbacteria bacterium]|jgi:uncharacterized membrane protein|nr:DUF975 family protein [Candidatus Margulisiibacteriota bacterium]
MERAGHVESIDSGDWKFSIIESLSYGFAKTKKFFWITLGLYILAYLAIYIVNFAGGLAVGFLAGSGSLYVLVAAVTVAFLISVYVYVMIALGWRRVFLTVLSGKAPALACFLDADNHQYFWQYIGASILQTLIVAVGTILFIIPGIVWHYTYMFTKLIVVDKKLGPTEALAASRKLVAGQRLNLFVWSLVMAGVNIIGLLCLGIGLLVTVPTTYYAYVYVYGKLSGKKIA